MKTVDLFVKMTMMVSLFEFQRMDSQFVIKEVQAKGSVVD
jgi:hypothetical protein